MQANIKSAKHALDMQFSGKINVKENVIKFNQAYLLTSDIVFLAHVCSAYKCKLTVKRSGTGLVTILTF